MGLAAPQIGKPLRVFLVKSKDKVITFINPRITAKSDKNAYKKPKAKPKKKNYIMEGCLSLPYYYGPVKRASSIEVEYQTPDEADSQKLKNCRQRFTGFVAQIIQHEIDHLDGKVFIDRLLEQGQRLFKEEGGQLLEVEI
jgi:peptide deformylase